MSLAFDNLSMLEKITRTPLDLLSYWDWFGEAAKRCLAQITSKTEAQVLGDTQVSPVDLQELVQDLATIQAQQRQILRDLVQLQVHAASTVTLMKRDAVLSRFDNRVGQQHLAQLRSASLLGPDLLDPALLASAAQELGAAKQHSYYKDVGDSLVKLAKTSQPAQAATKKAAQGSSGQPPNKKARTSSSKGQVQAKGGKLQEFKAPQQAQQHGAKGVEGKGKGKTRRGSRGNKSKSS